MSFSNLAVFLLIPCVGWTASFSEKAKGTSSGQVLKLAQGARGIAMGEAYSALADDAFALYWNPAGLNNIAKPRSAAFMHAFYVANINFGYAAWTSRLPNSLGTWAAAYQYLNIGSIDQTDDNGVDIGNYSPQDMAVTAAWAGVPHSLPLGAAFKYVSSKIAKTASTYAFDLGINSPVRFFKDRLALSATIKNLGPGLKFHNEREPLPLEIRLGSALTAFDRLSEESLDVIPERVIVTADVIASRDNKPAAAIGVEHAKIMGGPISGRAGLNTRTLDDISGTSGLFLGFGVQIRGAAIDYALAPMGHLGLTHRVSVGYGF